MAGPWTEYQRQDSPETGPWSEYQPDLTAAPGKTGRYVPYNVNPRTGIIDDPQKSKPTFGANFLPNEEDQAREFERAYNLPPGSAGVVDGAVVYTDPETGRLARSVASFSDAPLFQDSSQFPYGGGFPILSDPAKAGENVTDAMARFAQQVYGGGVGEAAPEVAGALATIGTKSPLIGAGVGAGTGAVVDSVRQALGNVFLTDRQPWEIDYINTGGHALANAAGFGAGRLLEGAAAKTVAKGGLSGLDDATNARLKAKLPSIEQALMDARAAKGPAPTIGEAANDPQLLALQDLAGNRPGVMDDVQTFYRNRDASMGRSVVGDVQTDPRIPRQYTGSLADRISPPPQPFEDPFARFGKGAGDVFTRYLDDRAKPAGRLYGAALYDEAGEPRTLPPDVAQGVMNAVDEALDVHRQDPNLRRLKRGLTRKVPNPIEGEPDITAPIFRADQLHSLRSDLSDTIETLNREGKYKGARRLQDALGGLDQALDTLPGYADARQTYEALSVPLDMIRNGKMEKVIKGELDGRRLGDFVNVTPGNVLSMFNAKMVPPRNVGLLREFFFKAGKGDEWNAGVRAWVDDVWSKASRDSTKEGVSVARSFRAAFDDRQRQTLYQALGAGDRGEGEAIFNGFLGMLRNMEAISRQPAANSRTAVRQDMLAGLQGGVSSWLRFSKGIREAATENLIDAQVNRKIGNLWTLMSDPNSVRLIKQFNTMQPRSRRAYRVLGELMARTGQNATEPYLPAPNRLPAGAAMPAR